LRFSRRDALRLAGAVAVAPALAACDIRGSSGDEDRRPSAPRPDAVPTDPRPQPAFAGAPPPGQLYFGASLPYRRPLVRWERTLGKPLALHRSYFAPDQTTKLVTQCVADLRRQRMPHVSMKPAGTWADVASGRRDDWLVNLFDSLEPVAGPVFLTIHHEPENDAGAPGMLAPDFVAMQRRAIRIAHERAPHVTVVPVLQHWTFDLRRKNIDPESWVVPESDVFGLDLYNPWSPTNGKPWRTFSSKYAEVEPWIAGKPVVIGEYGCRQDPTRPGRAEKWLRDAVSFAREQGVVSMAYFNSRVNVSDGTFELSGELESAFRQLLGSSWVARPA
jgi:hypothetical protein